MKPFFFSSKKILYTLAVCTGVLLSGQSSASGKPVEEEPKKAKNTAASSKNNNAVKIYPDMVKRKMHVVAKEKELDFFVFDLAGTLIEHSKMKPKDHLKIAGLARGKYIYRVFSGDEETASGEFEIR